MDIFGEHWVNHPIKIKENWNRLVSKDDVVLISGDVSWAMKLKDAVVDLEYIDSLPGQKVMIRGNHDYWFPKSGAKRKALPESIHCLYKSSVVINDIAYVGCKGLSFDALEYGDEDVHQKDLRKQLDVFIASCNHLKSSGLSYSKLVALIHYPPVTPGGTSSQLTRLLEEAGVSMCVYGHLHNADDFRTAIKGKVGGIDYVLASADYLSFAPQCLLS